MCKIPISDHNENGFVASVSVLVSYTELYDEYYFYVCCDDYDDPDSGIKITYKVVSLSPLTIETTIPGGGDDATVEQVPDPYNENQWRMEVCADHKVGQIKAGVVSAAYEPAWAKVDPGGGTYIGIGHNNTTHQNRFDDFNMEELRTTTEECTDCWCWCLDEVPFKYMKATIHDATQRAACLNAVEWDMTWNYNSGTSRWEGTAQYPRNAYYGGYVDVEFALYCDAEDDDDEDWPGRNWTLFFTNGVCCSPNAGGCEGGHQPDAETSTCDPFSLVFGPFYLSHLDLACQACYSPLESPPADGFYYITITEVAS